MNINIDKYFELLRNKKINEPLFDQNQLRSMVGQGGNNSSLFNKHGVTIMTISSISIIALIVGLLSLGSPYEDNTSSNIQPQTKTKSSISQTETNSSSTAETPSNVAAENHKPETINIEFDGFPLLKLSNNELNRLGIAHAEDGYEFITQSYVKPRFFNRIAYHGYDTTNPKVICRALYSFTSTDYDREIMDYEGWDMYSPAPLYPIGCAKLYNNGSIKDMFGFSPLLNEYSLEQFRREVKHLYNKEYSSEEIRSILSESDEIPVDKKAYPIFSQAAIAHLPFDDGESHLLLYFVPNKEFISALDPHNRKIVEANYEIIDGIVSDRKEFPNEFTTKHIPIISLNHSEIKRLGINKCGSIYKFTSQGYIHPNNYERASFYGYDTTDKYTLMRRNIDLNKDPDYDYEIIEYDGWNSEKPAPTYPIGAEVFHNKRRFSLFFNLTPLIAPSLRDDFIKEADSIFINKFKFSGIREIISNNDRIPVNRNDYNFFNQTVVTSLPMGIDGDFTLMFFIPNKEFIAALDPHNRKIVEANYEIIDGIMNEGSIKEEEPEEPEPYNIAGIEQLELTDEELEKFGIYREGTGYRMIEEQFYNLQEGAMVYFSTNKEDSLNSCNPQHSKEIVKDFIYPLNYDTSRKYTYIRYPVWFDSANVQRGMPMRYDGWPIRAGNPYPIILTNSFRHFKYNEKYDDYEPITTSYILHDSHNDSLMIQMFGVEEIHFWNEDGFSPNIPLIPIAIEFGRISDDPNIRWTQFLMWYIITDEFIDKLPKRYSEPLRKELDIISKVSSGEMSYEMACKGFTDTPSLLGICRMESANIKDVNVYPNPFAGGTINVDYLLTRDCRLKFDLHNANGEFIANLKQAAGYSAGQNKTSLAIKENLSPGMYMLTIQSNTGDQVVKKLLVK